MDLGELVPFPKLCQAAPFPWHHHDDDDGGPLQLVPVPDGLPDGPLHAVLGLPKLEEDGCPRREELGINRYRVLYLSDQQGPQTHGLAYRTIMLCSANPGRHYRMSS